MTEWCSGNIFIRPNRLVRAGDVIHGHCHNFDHTTIVFRGAVRVRKWTKAVRLDGAPVLVDGEQLWHVVADREFVAPAHFLVEAEARHEITALRDDTEFWCVYSHRTPQGEIVQNATGWEPAYGCNVGVERQVPLVRREPTHSRSSVS